MIGEDNMKITQKSNKITEKQDYVIHCIERNTEHRFHGTTKKDAIDFIHEHMAESKENRVKSLIDEKKGQAV